MIEQTFPRKYPEFCLFVDRVLLRVFLLRCCAFSFRFYWNAALLRVFVSFLLKFRFVFTEIRFVFYNLYARHTVTPWPDVTNSKTRKRNETRSSAKRANETKRAAVKTVWPCDAVSYRAKTHIEQFSVGHIQSVQSFAVSVGLSPSGLHQAETVHQAETAQIQYDTVPPIWYSYLDLESWSFPKTLYGGD